jgi:glycosyltransferase involved in cell wall biosynthesis
MKILLVGHFENKWSTNVEMKKYFSRSGDQITTFDYRKTANLNIKFYEKNILFIIFNKFLSFCRRVPLLKNNLARLYYKILGRSEMMDKLLKLKKKKFDLIIFLKTDTIDPSIISKFSTSHKTWYYFMDPPYVSFRINAIQYVKNATFASATFPDLAKSFKKINKNSFHIRQGIDVDIFKKLNKDKTIDLLFIGTKDKKREKIINYLKQYFKIKCYGKGWDNKPVYYRKLNILYNSSKIVLNLNRSGDGFSVRVFQILGTGSFIISEYSKDLSNVFKNKYNLIWYKDLNQLKILCNFYLKYENERNRISKNSYNFIKKNYTWNNIILKIRKKINVKTY